MSDHLADTPNQARHFCPICEPEADVTREILEVRYCAMHLPPAPGGIDDGAVEALAYLSGSQDAGGEDNRRWCELFHGKRRK